MHPLLLGLIAGTVGKAALDITTYLDMALRGRPVSRVPARVAEQVSGAATQAGRDIIEAAPRDTRDSVGQVAERMSAMNAKHPSDDEAPGSRAAAAGALSGFVIGLGLGAAYGLIRSRLGFPRISTAAIGGTALAAAAMAASDVPAVVTGATSHPRQWSTAAWLSDIVPHAAYGFVTASTFEILRPGPSRLDEPGAAIGG